MVAEPPSTGSKLSVGLMAMGSELAGFTILGLLLDYALGTLPWLTAGLTLLGFLVVFYHMVLISRALSRKNGKSP